MFFAAHAFEIATSAARSGYSAQDTSVAFVSIKTVHRAFWIWIAVEHIFVMTQLPRMQWQLSDPIESTAPGWLWLADLPLWLHWCVDMVCRRVQLVDESKLCCRTCSIAAAVVADVTTAATHASATRYITWRNGMPCNRSIAHRITTKT